MEEKSVMAHRLVLNNRKSGNFTGILDVLSFDLNEILLETEMGMLQIKGKDLHVNRLNLDKGEADIEGEIEALLYSDIPGTLKKPDKLLGKLFR